MKELKTQGDIDREILEKLKEEKLSTSQAYRILAIVRNRDKAEAIKRAKKLIESDNESLSSREDNYKQGQLDFIEEFFNLTEEVLKND